MALSQETISRVDKIALTDRVKAMRDELFHSKIYITADRSHICTLSWQETEGQHLYTRRGKLFEKICDELPIAIRDGELIVGSQTPHARGASPQIDYSAQAGLDIAAGDFRTRGDLAIATITEEDQKQIAEDAQYWKGKSPNEMAYATAAECGNEEDEYRKVGVCRPMGTGAITYHILPDYERILKKGLRGIIEEVNAKIATLDYTDASHADQWYLLEAGRRGCEAMIRYAHRHAELARKMAAEEKDPARKAELEKIASNCDWVPENPPRDFWEALQLERFIYLGQNLETGQRSQILGRQDQYLYPFYKKDIEKGTLTVEQAAELWACFQMKVAQMEVIHGGLARDTSQGHYGTKLVLGGLDREGNDATNELSYLMLHVMGLVKTAEPAYYVRWSPSTPKDFVIKGVWANTQVGGGNPAFHNDVHTIRMLTEEGCSLEDARDYAIYGCSHPHAYGAHHWSPGTVNGAKIFEITMYNGYDPRTKKKIGIESGDPRTFTWIGDWIEAYKKQWAYIVHNVVSWGSQVRFLCGAEFYSCPWQQILHSDVIKKGRVLEKGGCRYPQSIGQVNSRVFADVADALIAIKKFVYDEKLLTVDEILEACEHNFEGEKYARIQDMLKSAPKYGNDLDEPDSMYRLLNNWAGEFNKTQKNILGYNLRATFSAASLHIPFGKVTGALPNGRKAFTPLAAGSIDPVSGDDTAGPAATMASAGKAIDWTRTTDAVLNQKMPKSLLQTREQMEKFWSITETYFEDYDAYQVQWNIEDAEVYKAAKKDPASYKDLIVRVGGYSAYFVEIAPALQDEIIRRTEQYLPA